MAGFSPWEYAEKYGKGRQAEHSNQVALFMWANMACRFGLVIADDPNSYTVAGFALNQFENAGQLGYKIKSEPVAQLKWLHAIHNQGHGDAIRGGLAKAEGVKAGVADIFLPAVKPDTCQAGLYIELKVGNGKPSPVQLEFAADMQKAGYAVEFAWGWLEARNHILIYLGLPYD